MNGVSLGNSFLCVCFFGSGERCAHSFYCSCAYLSGSGERCAHSLSFSYSCPFGSGEPAAPRMMMGLRPQATWLRSSSIGAAYLVNTLFHGGHVQTSFSRFATCLQHLTTRGAPSKWV